MSAKTLDDEISQPEEEPSIEASEPDEDAELDPDQVSESEPVADADSPSEPEEESSALETSAQDEPAPDECNPESDEDPSQESLDAPEESSPSLSESFTRIGQLVTFHAQSKSVWRDRGLVALLTALVYLPMLGTFGLWDPWETHYGEVGRQITERNDWISTWWGSKWQDAGGAREGSYFFSKPILLMWLMAMGMRVFGVNEIGIRIGVCLVAMLGLVVVFSMGREVFSRRAGFLMAGVLGTAPFYAMLGRQAQTDMPFVGLMLVGMCFFMMAAFGRHREQPADKVGYGLTLGWLGLVSIPQLSLLVVGLARWRGGQNSIMTPLAQQPLAVVGIGSAIMILAALALAVGIFFKRGRAPGKDPDAPGALARLSLHRWFAIAMTILWLPLLGLLVGALTGGKPLLALNGWFVWGPVQAALYASCLLFAVYWMFARPDIRRRHLWLINFYVFIGLATLAKGLLGFMLPGAILFFYILFTREWRMLKDVELLRGIPIFIAVTFPWYAAMLIRHHPGFWNRFFVHDHFKRLASGVHQVDEGSFEHFIRWIGYGLFPWAGFIPAALARLFASREAHETGSDQARATLMVAIWAVIAFTLFTLSSTKFHHYIFPVIPALGVLIALALDEALDQEIPKPWPLYFVGAGIVAILAWDIYQDPQTLKNLYTYKYDRTWLSDAWDASFRWVIVGVTIPALVGSVLVLMRNLLVRRAAIGLILAASVALTYYELDVYMPRLSSVWSQKRLWDAYYSQCDQIDGPPNSDPRKHYCRQPSIAYKLNWRGENFYTQGEVIPIRDDDDFEHFLKEAEGKTFYGIMEMARYRGEFKRKLPAKLRNQTCLTYNSHDRFVLAKVPCAPNDPQRVPESSKK